LYILKTSITYLKIFVWKKTGLFNYVNKYIKVYRNIFVSL
jgi:hypothetical protein